MSETLENYGVLEASKIEIFFLGGWPQTRIEAHACGTSQPRSGVRRSWIHPWDRGMLLTETSKKQVCYLVKDEDEKFPRDQVERMILSSPEKGLTTLILNHQNLLKKAL